MASIVTLNVSITNAPTPSTLQGTVAIISQGATTAPAGTLYLLTQASSLTGILFGVLSVTTLSWSANVVTVTTTTPHGIPTGDVIRMTVAGATPTGYNGTFSATATGASTLTYPLTPNPGSVTTPGTITFADVAQLTAQVTTFFAQGSQTPVYILELGETAVTDGVAALTTFLNNNPATIYAVLVPREWDGNSAFMSLIASYENPTSKFYFVVTTTTLTYSAYTPLMKCVIAGVEAPGIPSTEFSMAAELYRIASYNPSTTNKVTPNAFAFVYGVTPYPTVGNATLLANLKAANINYIGTGAEGGITNTIFLWGVTLDGNDFTYWYSVDWCQINLDLNVANAIINGSNNPINPLYLNQDGINRLEAVIASTMTSAVSFGLALGTVIQTELASPAFLAALSSGTYAAQIAVNAVPFVTYYTLSPGDYKIGKYAGFAVSYVPARGFINIIINLNVSTFIL